jgi:hypothetical protein
MSRREKVIVVTFICGFSLFIPSVLAMYVLFLLGRLNSTIEVTLAVIAAFGAVLFTIVVILGLRAERSL